MRIVSVTCALALALLAACDAPVPVDSGPEIAPLEQVPAGPRLSSRQAMNNFNAVVRRMEPVAERYCRREAPNLNCDFKIVVDERPAPGPNAFQTLDEDGRPIIGFNVPLIAEARNQDEIAFVFAHEAAHHIAGHIPRSQSNAILGGLLGGIAATAIGVDASSADRLQEVGATVGARSYSKNFELEADALGTRITAEAGYDPLRGAQFFFRIPDPGNRFLGTHPPNADRLRTVQQVAAGL
ncbi:M48 family metalloprotease [Cognatiyoonia sp. IB215182]|uniref:M48 family metalloprotease n=1 Tax=Cognatiyoonia sp. IB215182 TaxID=3097353 RepID=UPI002A16799E|nr:M48 family metalloprotease [Cognatiyoonia sp. IB215182]MDX8351090.1 M48 family metalloprotease [Cognatiyoonia sp. IB215182]